MRRTRARRLSAVLLASALVIAGCGRDDDDGADKGPDTSGSDNGGETSGAFINAAEECPSGWNPTEGIEGDTIKIGSISPSTGAVTATVYNRVTQGMRAHFEAVNAEGGVKAGDGKTYKIEVVEKDDSYDASKTLAATQDLIENEKVFAMVANIGTETSIASRGYVNEQCVPSIALGTGSPEWGKNNTSPWYIGGLPSYATEAVAFLDYYSTVKPDATIAVLYQNDDFGQSYLGAIKKYADGDSEMEVVAEEPFDIKAGQTPEAAITRLAQSKADVLFVGISGTSCAGSLTFIPADWQPARYLSITCSGKVALSFGGDAVEGIYTSQATLVPDSPTDREHPKMQEFFQKGASVGLSQDELEDGIHAAGWGFAAIFLEGLKQTPEVTRDGLMNALWQVEVGDEVGLLRPGQKVVTNNAEDPWLIEGLRIVQRKGDDWEEVHPLTDYNGRSNELAAS